MKLISKKFLNKLITFNNYHSKLIELKYLCSDLIAYCLA